MSKLLRGVGVGRQQVYKTSVVHVDKPEASLYVYTNYWKMTKNLNKEINI